MKGLVWFAARLSLFPFNNAKCEEEKKIYAMESRFAQAALW